MFTRQHRAAVALVVALSLGPALGPAGTGRAQAATAQEAAELKAKQAYSRGAELYKEHKFSEAAAAFTEGYGYKPHYAFLWNLALAYRALGAHDKAIDAYQRYLKSCPTTATADRAPNGPADDGAPGRAEHGVPPADQTIEREHRMALGGREIDYRSTAGTLTLRDDEGRATGDVPSVEVDRSRGGCRAGDG